MFIRSCRVSNVTNYNHRRYRTDSVHSGSVEKEKGEKTSVHHAMAGHELYTKL